MDSVSNGVAKSGRRQSKIKKTLVGVLGCKNSWLSIPSLQINKCFFILNEAKSFCHVINALLAKLIRSRWLDISRGLFLAFLWTESKQV